MKKDFEIMAGRGEILGVVTSERIPLPEGASCVGFIDMIIGEISVSENLFLGNIQEFERLFFIDRKKLNRHAKALLYKYGIHHISPEVLASELSHGEKKIIEICRAIEKNPPLLMLDNVFCALDGRWRGAAKVIIEQYASLGKSVLFITRDIDEARSISNRIIDLRAECKHASKKPKGASCEVILRGINLCREGVYNVNLKLHRGELLGILGLYHSGIHALGKAFCGKLPLERGRVYAKGKRIKGKSCAKKRKIIYIGFGLGYSEKLQSLCGDCDVIVADNILLGLKSQEAQVVCDALRKKCSQGTGVVFISESIDEQICMCDRIAVLSHGCLAGEYEQCRGYNKEEILGAILSGGEP